MRVLEAKCQCGVTTQLDTSGFPEGSRMLAVAQAVVQFGVLCEACAKEAEELENAERAASLTGKVEDIYRTQLRRSKVPDLDPAFDWATVPPDVAAAARQWQGRKALILTLWGPMGTGKTELAKAVFRERMRPVVRGGEVVWRRAAWRSMTAYMQQQKAEFGSWETRDAIELAQGGVLLGVDDIDKVRPTDYGAEQVYQLIDGAYRTKAPLVVSLNGSLQQLMDRYGGEGSIGDAIASRLSEGLVVHYDGPDRRVARGRTTTHTEQGGPR